MMIETQSVEISKETHLPRNKKCARVLLSNRRMALEVGLFGKLTMATLMTLYVAISLLYAPFFSVPPKPI